VLPAVDRRAQVVRRNPAAANSWEGE